MLSFYPALLFRFVFLLSVFLCLVLFTFLLGLFFPASLPPYSCISHLLGLIFCSSLSPYALYFSPSCIYPSRFSPSLCLVLLTFCLFSPLLYFIMPCNSHLLLVFILPALRLRFLRTHLTRRGKAAVLISASCKSLQDEENVV